MVLLPEPDRPVNHKVAPFCLSSCARSSRLTCPSCQVMFVALIWVISSSVFRSLFSVHQNNGHQNILYGKGQTENGPIRRPVVRTRDTARPYAQPSRW